MDPGQLASTQHPGDVVEADAQLEQLTAGDYAVLVGKEGPGALVHGSSVRCFAPARPPTLGWPVDDRLNHCAVDAVHLVHRIYRAGQEFTGRPVNS